ncbi:RNA helicase Mov10l1-like [Amphiura filiformis]|uniref:RNA helicase Mov10l1-like n=1 Tax=Amphiura filiformis TaxID=82378 RepID=UPI003B20BE03
MQELEQNKRGIIISSNLHLGSMMIDDTKTIQVSIKNVGSIAHTLKSCEACSLSATVSIKVYNRSYGTLDGSPSGKPFILPALVPSTSTMVAVLSVTARQLGRTSFQVIFDFGSFQIGRTVTMTVEDPQILALGPSSASICRGKVNRRDRLKDVYSESRSSEGWIIPGRRVAKNYDMNVPVKLPQFVVPKDLEQAVLQDQDVTICYPELNQGLNMENFSIRCSALLHLEEVQMQIDMRQFDLEKVSMKPRLGEYLSLEVPGLAEGRPSVMVGDKIILSLPNANKYDAKYEGIVHEVLSDVVLLKFNEKFQESYQAEEYNVAFTFSRTPLRRCHQAADFAKNLGMQVLFPSRVEARPPQVNITYRSQTTVTTIKTPRIPTNLPRLASPKPNQSPHQSTTPSRPIQGRPANAFGTPKGDTKFLVPKINSPTNVKQAKTSDGTLVANFFNAKLNVRQKAAVVRVLQGEGRPTPYIIFGPPGTGKTVTVVESILQVHQHIPSSRILACTPSNSAADLLAERLHLSGHIKHHELIRLNSFRRNEDSIPDIIRQYCRDGEELEKIAHYRMLVCTCTTSGSFYQLGLKAGHFTHVFVDEAGQATEPETLIPAGLAVGAEGQIILAGDPMQLGPVLASDIAKDYGLDLSLLERLTKRPLYRRDAKKFRDHGNYDPLLVTKLVDNYRSHPALLKLSSDIFYHGELEPQANPELTSSLCDWEMLPNKTNCPLIFHGIKGEDMREGNSPSWFNPMEVVQVAKYLKSLLALEKPVIKTSDIGIITPYRKQVEKIRLIMTTLEVHGVKVGSVEEFQGQERMIMIISTVRSTESLVDFDVRHHLGFVSNPKRFNVSITRAQALQIIIGNPHVLSKDRYWRALLRYCVNQQAYIGCDLPELGDEIIEEGDLDRGIEDDIGEEESINGDNQEENIATVNGYDAEEPQAATATSNQPHQSYGEIVASLNKSPQNGQSRNVGDQDSVQHQGLNEQTYKPRVLFETVQNQKHESTCSVEELDTSKQSRSCDTSLPAENVQSVSVCAKESAQTLTNSTRQQTHCIQDVNNSSRAFPSQPHEHVESENVYQAQCGKMDSLNCGVGDERKRDKNRNVTTLPSGESSPAYVNKQSLSNNMCRDSQTTSNSKGEVEVCATSRVQLQAVASSNHVQHTKNNTKLDNNDSILKEKTLASTPHSQHNHHQTSRRCEQQGAKKKSPPQGAKSRNSKTAEPAPSVVPVESEADRQKRLGIINTLYPSAAVSDLLSSKKQSQMEGAKRNPENCQNTAGARCQSPRVSEASSEPSVHLSDDSGPEDFQDYTPSRSASDISIDEKSQSRGWWTKEQIAKRPRPTRRKHRNNSNRPVEQVAAGRGGNRPVEQVAAGRGGNRPVEQQGAAGRGGYHPHRQRPADGTPKNYYVGLGRGRGRPMQMAAQMDENGGGTRPFSFGRGNFHRK